MKLVGTLISVCFLAVFKTRGDDQDQQTQSKHKNSWSSDEQKLWPHGAVYYLFDERYTDGWKENIREAMEDIQNVTDGCIEFQNLTSVPLSPPYIQFIYHECKSHLGLQLNGPTDVYIGPDCGSHGHILHELYHALGAVHEHNRADRDFYIDVNWDNIKPGHEKDFKKNEIFTITSNTPYDYRSIMQYPRNAHAIDESVPTLIPKYMIEDGLLEYPNSELSPVDIVELSKIYGCPIKTEFKKPYLDYTGKLFESVIEGFNHCINNMTRQDDSCQQYQQPLMNMVVEFKKMAPTQLYHSYKIQYQQALDKQAYREEMIKLKNDIEAKATNCKQSILVTDLREKNEKLQQDLDKHTEYFVQLREENQKLKEGLNTQTEDMQQLREEMTKLKNDIKTQAANWEQSASVTDLREENQKLKEGLNTQALEMQQLRDENKLLKRNQTEHTENLNNLLRYLSIDQGLFNKPWFGEPDVMIFQNHGYQVIENKHPLCEYRFPVIGSGYNDASINSQAEFDFITDLLGDRKAVIGGHVKMSTDHPSYDEFFSGFRWHDESSTLFFHTLEKKLKLENGAGKYFAHIQSGEIYIEGFNANWMVCEYH